VSGQHAPWRASRDPLGSLGLEGNEQGRRRPARRGRRHGRHGGVDATAVHGNAVGWPCRVRTCQCVHALGCARARGCEQLGFGPGVGRKIAEGRRSWRSSGRHQRVAADKASAVGHRRMRLSARVGGEACTEHPKEGAPLPCSRVCEANLHGKAMRRGVQGRIAVARSSARERKSTKGPPLTSQVGVRACGGARLCEGACEITGAWVCACRRLGHDGGPE
jgi:hypothetical protein